VKALDAGPMLAAARRPIGPDATSDDVERDLARVGAFLLLAMVNALASGAVVEVLQDESAATYAPRLTREDGAIDWTRPASAIHNLIRGLHPWPHAFTYHEGRRLILLRSHVVRPAASPASAPNVIGAGGQQGEDRDRRGRPIPPGTIVKADGDRLHVSTGSGIVAITELQGEGRRPMTARAFLAGSQLGEGDVLTPTS
jgi:methionyl-tRNA formyltransferase